MFLASLVVGLLHIHSEDPSKAGGKCGPIRDDEELEAMLFAIDSINADQTLIPNVTFGFDVRDTCYSENIALGYSTSILLSEKFINIHCYTSMIGSLVKQKI